jgi:hypothetical protein
MLPTDTLRETADQGLAGEHFSRAELVVKACVKYAREQLSAQMPAVHERKFDFMPSFQNTMIRQYLVGVMWKYGEQYEMPTDARARAFLCLISLLMADGASFKDAQDTVNALYTVCQPKSGAEHPALLVAYKRGTEPGVLAQMLDLYRDEPQLAGAPYRLLDRAKPVSAILGISSAAISLIFGQDIFESVGVGIVIGFATLAIALAIHKQMVRP